MNQRALKAMRSAFNRDDEAVLVAAAKRMCREAMLCPSSVNFAALKTAHALLGEALGHERTDPHNNAAA